MSNKEKSQHYLQNEVDDHFKNEYPLLYAGVNFQGERPIQSILELIRDNPEFYILAITGVPGAGKTTAKLSMADWFRKNIPNAHLEFISYDHIHAQLRADLAKINTDLDNDRFWQKKHWEMIWLRFRDAFEQKKRELAEYPERVIFMIETPAIGKVQRGYQFIEYLSVMYKHNLCYVDYIANPAIQMRAGEQRSGAAIADLAPPENFQSFLLERGLDLTDDFIDEIDRERAFKKLLSVFGGMANQGFIYSIEKERIDQATMAFYEKKPAFEQLLLYYILTKVQISEELQELLSRRNVRREMAHAMYRMYYKMRLPYERAQVIFNEFYNQPVKLSLLSGE